MGGGPFIGVFATLSRQQGFPNPELPLSIRAAFRPVLTSPPNVLILVEAMLLTSGFSGARSLVRGVVEGLRKLTKGNIGEVDQARFRSEEYRDDATSSRVVMST